jgi:hypothetical protein
VHFVFSSFAEFNSQAQIIPAAQSLVYLRCTSSIRFRFFFQIGIYVSFCGHGWRQVASKKKPLELQQKLCCVAAEEQETEKEKAEVGNAGRPRRVAYTLGNKKK